VSPRRPPSPCIEPDCPRLVQSGARCGDHALANGNRYAGEWRTIRAQYLVAHQSCEWAGCEMAATVVDHIDGSGPSGDNGWRNLQALCQPCHARKTAVNDGGFGRRPA